MFTLIGWIVFGALVGILAKALHPGDAEPQGCLATIGVGVAGSFVGGSLMHLLGYGTSWLQPSGFFASVIGGIIFLMAWRWWSLRNESTPKNFFGKRLK